MANQYISWHFIPPRLPHFGGLWEAGIKAAKTRLTIGQHLLTFEEMYTVLTCIEACLNSRPITLLSNDPNDLSALTPSHFLIGDHLSAYVELNILNIPVNRLSRWQQVEQIRQHFWQKWSREYLTQLQQRPINKSRSTKIDISTMVVIHEENLSPLKWQLGRVSAVHPGSDGIVRVVSINTRSGVLKRAIKTISVVPVD